jgi:general secretion pathway protein G
MTFRKSIAGFTLIEVLVTLTIVGLLTAMAFPLAETQVQRNKEQELRTALRQIREALDAYKKASDENLILKTAEESGYTKNLNVLVDGVENAKDPNKEKLYFLRRLPRDPLFKDASVPAEKTWGKRSYASPPDNPQEGNDVFDIYSQSVEIGLNGVAYREW